MDENVLQDALNMARGVEELPVSITDPETVEIVATAYATWMFNEQSSIADDSPDYDEETQLVVVRNAIAAAYIAGHLDAISVMPEQATTTSVVGKSGTIVNIYVS